MVVGGGEEEEGGGGVGAVDEAGEVAPGGGEGRAHGDLVEEGLRAFAIRVMDPVVGI